MAPPAELFEEQKAEQQPGGWSAARHDAEQVAAAPSRQQQPARTTAWLRDMLSGWTSKAPA